MNLVKKVAHAAFIRKLRRNLKAKLTRQVQADLSDVDPAVLRLVISTELFDPEFYVFKHRDIGRFPGGAIRHFLLYGLAEDREVSASFSLRRYINDHPELNKSKTKPFLDAIQRYDRKTLESRWPTDDTDSLAYLLTTSGLFDAAWYLQHNPDVAAAGYDPLDHFVSGGASELRDPGPGFDSAFYRHAYIDYRLTGRTPIESYLRHGRHSGRSPRGLHLYELWRTQFDTIDAGDRARIANAADRVGLVVGVLFVDREAAADFPRVLASWIDQISSDWSLRIVRSHDVESEAWAACVAAIKTQPLARVSEPTLAIADVPQGTPVVLGAGACFLRPHASTIFAERLQATKALAAYADHDRLDEHDRCSRPVFKPAMSPEFMRRLAYAGHVVAVRVGPELDTILKTASSDAASALARLLLDMDPARVLRIPFVLFHIAGSAQVGSSGTCEPVPTAVGTHRLPVTRLPDPPRVAVIIPTRDHGELVRDCVESIETRSDYPAARIAFVIVDNGTTDADTLSLLDSYRLRDNFTIVSVNERFNFSKLCNAGARASDADILVFLNNDTTVNRPDWLLRFVEQAVKPGVGFVGAQLLYPDRTVQHGGVALGVQGVGAHRLTGVSEAAASQIDVTREMVSMTGACLAVRSEVFWQLEGFDTVLQIAFNDVDLCARSFEAGYQNIYIGEPLLIHHESKSRGFDLTRPAMHRNIREAIYTRERHDRLFRDDPSYSPNLSIDRVGALAFPPRVVRPWRRSQAGQRRILLLSAVHGIGHGVAIVVAEQAKLFIERGWEVTIGGPPAKREMTYPGCRRVHLWDATDAACYAVAEGLDCVMSHTPPFFSIVRHLGMWPLVFWTDHGEPMPHLFGDREAREDIDWEKRFCAPLARRVFAISNAIYAQQYRRDAVVVRNGNSHLSSWTAEHASSRAEIRDRFGLSDRFVVLNVCRFGEGERRYKGIDQYGAVASDLRYIYPDLADRVEFLLVGRGNTEAIDYATSLGLTVRADVSDAEMIDLYVAADLYMNLSAWEGYNLGIGQALAMGLDVLASDIDAHREFGVQTLSNVPDLCAAVAQRVARHDETPTVRRARIDPWSEPLTRMAETIEGDLAAASSDWRI